MPSILSRFRIEALHNRHTIDIPIKDNRLILVGENGTGKSTVTNFIYFFLTRQWQRLTEYEFSSILAVIDNEEFILTKEDLQHRTSLRTRRLASTRRAEIVRLKLQEELLTRSLDEIIRDDSFLKDLTAAYGAPRSYLVEQLRTLSVEPMIDFNDTELFRIEQSLKSKISDQILYLPTYRRIEQDLKSIFRDVPFPEFDRFMDRWKHRTENDNYIELIEFGMEDVETMLQAKMDEIKESVRNDLNNLTGTYLRDVIRGSYRSYDVSEIIDLQETTVNAIFNRIDKAILPDSEQKTLRSTIDEIKASKKIPEKDKVVAHFFTRLLALHINQQKKENSIRKFVDVCNSYLSGKELHYDNLKFEITIRQQNMPSLHEEKNKSNIIAMSTLSSGEKQIVSLFSRIYLSDRSNYFVIIDEPELSLSVLWQKKFLPDILATERCNGLIAVTHSPFIFDNLLDTYTLPLENFMEMTNDVR